MDGALIWSMQGVCTLQILKFPAFPGWFWAKFPAFSRLGLKTPQTCTEPAFWLPGPDSGLPRVFVVHFPDFPDKVCLNFPDFPELSRL